MSTANKLSKLIETKQAIKQSIIDKGVDISDDTVFADYPSKIDSIMTGDSESVWNLITCNGTRGQYLFYDCKNITELDVSHLDTSNMTNMNNMFGSCQSLTSLDVSNFNTSNVKNMSYMFNHCESLTELDLSNFNTSNVTDMSYMFNECEKLPELNLSSFNTSNVTNMNTMFGYCHSFTELDLNNFDVSKVTNISGMFYFCSKLISLDVSNWDIGHITGNYNVHSAFNYCISLVDLYPPQNINANMTVNSSTALSHDSLMRIINNLMTATSTKTLTLGATNLAKLSSEEIAIATNKGWTVK